MTGKKLQFGFTLVELLVVISIIALLLSIMLPSLGKARSSAMQIRCASNLKQISLAVNLYLNANDDTYPCTEEAKLNGYFFWTGQGWRPVIEPYLGGNIDANSPSVLWCPQDKTAKEKYKSTSYAYSMCFYFSPAEIEQMTSCFDVSIRPTSQKSSAVLHPSGKIIIGEWLSNHFRIDDDKGWWCREGRRNYLFVDGQVNYLKAREIRSANDEWPNPNLTVGGIKGIDWLP